MQRSRVDILKSLDPNQRILGDIVYPAICQNQRNFPLHQTEINASMHTTLVDWLVELCDKSNIQSTTLCLAIHVMDEYLRREGGVETYRFQLLGCTCLIMAAKEEQIEVCSCFYALVSDRIMFIIMFDIINYYYLMLEANTMI